MRSVKPWVVGAVAAVLLGAVVVLLVRAPVPAVSGPSSAALTGPESVPHTHVMTAPSGAPVPVGGLSSSAGGYSFVVTGMAPFTFHIQGPDGQPVTKFQIVHDKPLHLIVVRRNLSGYQHLHPALAADGTWTVALSLPPPGPYRAYADFTTGNGTAVVLGVDLPAPDRARTEIANDLVHLQNYGALQQMAFNRPIAAQSWLQSSNPSERWKWDFLFQDVPPVKGTVDPSSLPYQPIIPLKKI